MGSDGLAAGGRSEKERNGMVRPLKVSAALESKGVNRDSEGRSVLLTPARLRAHRWPRSGALLLP